MSEDKTTAEVAASPDASPTPGAPERTIENPMLAWMRGGTVSSAYEMQLAKQKHDAEQARKVEDARAAKAADGSGEAKQHKHVVGGNKKFPGIVLEVRHPKDNTVLDYIECELIIDDTDLSLSLNMACAVCAQRGVTDQFKFNQKHKRFELDQRRAGELWVNPRNPRHIVTLAGTIHLTEAVTCPNLGCGTRFKIDDSVVRYL